MKKAAILLTLLISTSANAYTAEEGFGPNPVLPEPEDSLLPTVNTASAKPWKEGAQPQAAKGLQVNAFAKNLKHPRWIYVLPNGDVLVAESDAPEKPDDSSGIKGFVQKLVMKDAGSGKGSADRITLLRDTDGDGVAETQTTFLENLKSPFGMALIGNNLYVANTNAIVSFTYQNGATKITGPGTKIIDLPGGKLNHHWTKNIIASKDGTKLYATIGSNSNVGENGLDKEISRAAIWEVDLANKQSRIFASGLRNPNGMDFEPQTGILWTVANERDELGDNLVPDYLTSVKDGAFYGWPYSYYGQHVDKRVDPQNPEMVAKAIPPDYAIGNHTASLGLTFNHSKTLPYGSGAFIGQHGSWNRKPRSGYKVIFVPFANGKPSAMPEDVLTGFVSGENAQGRPVGVAISKAGDLLVADDVGNTIWRVSALKQQ